MSNKEKEPLFSAKNMKYLTGPFGKNNPVIVQILGICSALAVTVQLKPAIVMALSVLAARVGGVIDGAEAVSKSFPDFFDVIKKLNVKVNLTDA